MESSISDHQKLLRNSLIGNAGFSLLSALIILASGNWLSRFLGLHDRVALTVLAVNARRPEIKISDAWTAVVLDVVWVLGSYVVIFAMPFTAGGKWLIVAV